MSGLETFIKEFLNYKITMTFNIYTYIPTCVFIWYKLYYTIMCLNSSKACVYFNTANRSVSINIHTRARREDA